MKSCHQFLYCTLILLQVASMAYGQPHATDKPEFSREKIYVHLDKTVLVAGETLHYKVYTSNSESKVLYFMLLGRGPAPALQWRINLLHESVAGKYLVPADLEPGFYELYAYTNRMRSGSFDQVYRQPMLVESLTKKTADTLYIPETAVTQKTLPETPAVKQSLVVNTAKAFYKPGETVELEISAVNLSREETADLSIAVKEQVPFKDILRERTIAEQFLLLSEPAGAAGSTASESGPCKTPLENKGFMLEGHVSDAAGNALSSQGIILSVADSAAHMLFARSDAEGKFTFYLDRFFDNRELILQVAGNKSSPKKWVIENKRMERGRGDFEKFAISDEASAWVESKKEFSLIEAVYQSKEEIRTVDVPVAAMNYFSPPDYLIIPSDYANLVNFREIADNILPTVKYAMRNKVYTVQIFIPSADAWFESDMILLNGVPFTDLGYLATLGSKDIARIEVIASNFLLGDITYSGLLSVYTHDGKIAPNYLKNYCYTWKNEVSPSNPGEAMPVATAGPSSDPHIPDFRSVLYWDPGVKIQGDGKKTLKFKASQVTGLYQVVVCGLSSGDPLHATTTFEVK
jgi:hypothetical protein